MPTCCDLERTVNCQTLGMKLYRSRDGHQIEFGSWCWFLRRRDDRAGQDKNQREAFFSFHSVHCRGGPLWPPLRITRTQGWPRRATPTMFLLECESLAKIGNLYIKLAGLD